MPESKGRRKSTYTPQTETPKAVKVGNPTWWAPVMVTLFVVGLLWIVVYYIAGSTLPLMKDLAWGNILIGFGLIFAGFAMSTRWR